MTTKPGTGGSSRSGENARIGKRSLFFLFPAALLVQIYNAVVLQNAWPYLLALVANLGFAFIRFLGLVKPAAGPP